jgi:hypothetical protein
VSLGIWSEAKRFEQQPSCPSGNCDWKDYTSTGWCSKCQDVTSSAKITNCTLDAHSLDIDRLNTTDSCLVDLGHGNKFQVLGSHGYYEYTASAQQFSYSMKGDKFNIVKGAVWPLGLLNYNLSMPLDNETYAGITNPIVALGNVYVEQCDDVAVEKGLCVKSALECALSLCTRKFETSVVNGTTHIRSIEEDFGCLSQAHDDSASLLAADGDYPSHCWQTGTPCDEPHFTNITLGQDPSFCSDGIGVQTAEYADWALWTNHKTKKPQNLQTELLDRVIGNQTAELLSGAGGVHQDNNGVSLSNFVMDYINATGLELVLAGVAASLTQQALLANTSETEYGTVWTTKTYVAVDWPWLTYPATLVLCSIILLALTALHSHRCGLRIWKSSMLPLLYRTLDPDLLARQPVLHDVSAMTGVAGKAKVTLVETSRDDGVVLTQ